MAATLFSCMVVGLSVAALSFFLGRWPPKKTDKRPANHQHNRISLARLAIDSHSSHQTLTLVDGRSLGYAVYGVSSGPTFFFLHGFADCRLTGALFDEPAKKLGTCVIGIDRPGWGLSSARPGRRALDFTGDLQQLAAHLDLKSYGVIGVSGGGPYALACAYALPAEQLKSVSMLCATGPWDMTMRFSPWIPWLLREAQRLSPALTRWMCRKSMVKYRNMSSEEFIAATKSRSQGWLARLLGLHENDIALLQDEDFLALVYRGLQENCRKDVEVAMEEWRIMTTSNLAFRLEEIRKDLPIELWYGRQDTNVPWQVGQALSKCIGGKTRLFVREDTHLGILVNYRAEVLEMAMDAMHR